MSTATRMDFKTKTLPEAWKRVDEQLAQLDTEQRATANVMVYLHHDEGVMLRLEYYIGAATSTATTAKRQQPEIDSRSASPPPVSAGDLETARPDPLSSVLLRELDQTEGVDDLCSFIRKHSIEDVTAVCRSYPIDGIRLNWGAHSVGDLTSEPAMRDIRRFELITTFAQILVRYEANLKLPELGLPKSLPAKELEKLLLARLMPFIRSQRGIDITQTLRVRLYDFAMAFVHADKNEEALDCLVVSRPSLKSDHDFWIAACQFNIAANTSSQADIRRAIDALEPIVSGAIKVPSQYIDGAKQMLQALKKEVK